MKKEIILFLEYIYYIMKYIIKLLFYVVEKRNKMRFFSEILIFWIFYLLRRQKFIKSQLMLNDENVQTLNLILLHNEEYNNRELIDSIQISLSNNIYEQSLNLTNHTNPHKSLHIPKRII